MANPCSFDLDDVRRVENIALLSGSNCKRDSCQLVQRRRSLDEETKIRKLGAAFVEKSKFDRAVSDAVKAAALLDLERHVGAVNENGLPGRECADRACAKQTSRKQRRPLRSFSLLLQDAIGRLFRGFPLDSVFGLDLSNEGIVRPLLPDLNALSMLLISGVEYAQRLVKLALIVFWDATTDQRMPEPPQVIRFLLPST